MSSAKAKSKAAIKKSNVVVKVSPKLCDHCSHDAHGLFECAGESYNGYRCRCKFRNSDEGNT
jgi:hypothetical protein